MEIAEAARFLEAFRNDKARKLVEEMVLVHYSDAVLEHYPGKISQAEVVGKTTLLRDRIFSLIDRIREEPAEVGPLFRRLSRKNQDPDPVWFDAFGKAYENYKHLRKLPLKAKHLQPYFTGDSYCDVGCGGGDLVFYVKNHFPRFREYAGIDVLDWRTEDIRNSINFQMLDLSQPGAKSREQYDTMTCIAVLHHIGGRGGDIDTFLGNLRDTLSPAGRVIIEEDVMLPSDEIGREPAYRRQARERAGEQPLFAAFLELGAGDQKDVMILVDLIANALSGGIQDMAFPFGFRSVEQWKKRFSINGFKTMGVEITGFQNGIFNRSSHVYFALARK